jgi:hypothetical protein
VDVAASQQDAARGNGNHFVVREGALQNLLGPATTDKFQSNDRVFGSFYWKFSDKTAENRDIWVTRQL